MTQEEGWGPFHLDPENAHGSGGGGYGGGTYSHEPAHFPVASAQPGGSGGNQQVPPSVVPPFVAPAFAPNRTELYGARRTPSTSSEGEGG